MLELSSLLLLAALVWLWFDSMRARERARSLGKRPGARDANGRMALRRTYNFEFSDTGNNRRSGSVVMLGGELESLYTEPYLIQ